MKEHKFDKSTFIGGWYIPEEVCDNLVDVYYDNITETIKGRVGKNDIVPETKISTEFIINADKKKELIGEYKNWLGKTLSNYKERYPYSNKVSDYSLHKYVKIQHYKPSEGFFKWHAENTGLHQERHLVFMTYLNTLDNAGTEFYHQDLTTPCIKGLTLIWPSAWTHTHRGVINNDAHKFIITGWFNFNVN